MKIVFINRRNGREVETVDSVSGEDVGTNNPGPIWKEAARLLGEYQASDPAGEYYISRRSTREWAAAMEAAA